MNTLYKTSYHKATYEQYEKDFQSKSFYIAHLIKEID